MSYQLNQYQDHLPFQGYLYDMELQNQEQMVHQTFQFPGSHYRLYQLEQMDQ